MVALIIPPITPVPMATRLPAPAPVLMASGNTLLDRKGTYDEFLADFDEDQLKKY